MIVGMSELTNQHIVLVSVMRVQRCIGQCAVLLVEKSGK